VVGGLGLLVGLVRGGGGLVGGIPEGGGLVGLGGRSVTYEGGDGVGFSVQVSLQVLDAPTQRFTLSSQNQYRNREHHPGALR